MSIKHTTQMSKQLSMFEKKPYKAPIVLHFAAHMTPNFQEMKGHDYILFGSKNNYPNYLIDLFNRSAKHNAIVNAKVNYTSGAGWQFEKGSAEDEKMKAFIKNVNMDGESLDEITTKINIDLELFGGFYLEIVWKKSGRGIASIKHVDYSYVRSNKENSEFYYTSEWFDKKGNMKRDVEDNDDWAVFSPFDSEKTKGSQLFFYKSYRPSMDVYALPEYTGAIEYIEIDTLISSHHYNNIKNGFVGNAMITFLNGEPTSEEQILIEKQIKDKFTGSEGQRIIVNFADGADRAAVVTFLTQPDVYKQLTDLNKSVEQEILTGHRVTSGMLVGIKTEGQLGGRSEMTEAYELMKNTYIEPKQRILEKVFNYLLSFNFATKIELKEAKPIGLLFGEQTLLQIADKDEMRAMQGLVKIEPPVKTQEQITLDAIQNLSPLVANKVLNSLTTNQIIGLVGLPPIPGGDTVPQPVAAAMSFSSQKVIEVFKKYGSPRSDFEVIKSRFISFEGMADAKLHEDYVRKTFDQYSALERNVLDLLRKDSLMDAKELGLALNVPENKISKVIAALVRSGDLKKASVNSGEDKIPKYKITESGVKIIEEKSARTEDIYIKYSYEVVAGMGSPIIATTRDFCRDLINENKFYSRDEIESITDEVGYNVFEMRGGWYTQKNGVAVPHCRHLWQQNIVKNKK